MLHGVSEASRAPTQHLFDTALRELASARLASFERQQQPDPSLRPAAVSIILTADNTGEACFLLTRRSPG